MANNYVVVRKEITIERTVDLVLPTVEAFVKAEVQNGVPCIWALVDADSGATQVGYNFLLLKTDELMSSQEKTDHTYIDSFQVPPDMLHLYQYTAT